MSVQLRLLAKDPGSLRPSVPEPATELAELAAPVGPEELADPAFDDTAAEGELALVDPIAADAAGGGPPALFDVHPATKPSATHAALAAVVMARLRRR